MHVCLRWLSQTIEDLVPQEREGGARVSSKEKTSVMRLKQNAKTNRRGRAERDRDRERESLEKCHSNCPYFCSHFAVLVYF